MLYGFATCVHNMFAMLAGCNSVRVRVRVGVGVRVRAIYG